MRSSEAWNRLLDAWMPGDEFQPTEAVRQYYATKYSIVAGLRPLSICEFGVRAGYSAFMFLQAAPNASYLGIDIEEHVGYPDQGLMPWNMARHLEHARTILPESAKIQVADTQKLGFLHRRFDLVHVDATHTYEGALHDLELAALHGRYLLLDDYSAKPVRDAAETFLTRNSIYRSVEIPDLIAGNLLLWRDP